MRARIRRRRDGSYDVRLSSEERSILGSLPAQVIPLIEISDSSAQRIFPPAYSSDVSAEAEYRQMVGSSLQAHHVDALKLLETTSETEKLTAQDAESWLGAINSLRLILGTRLDVSEEMTPLPDGDPRVQGMALYHWLSWLQEQLVSAMSDSL